MVIPANVSASSVPRMAPVRSSWKAMAGLRRAILWLCATRVPRPARSTTAEGMAEARMSLRASDRRRRESTAERLYRLWGALAAGGCGTHITDLEGGRNALSGNHVEEPRNGADERQRPVSRPPDGGQGHRLRPDRRPVRSRRRDR